MDLLRRIVFSFLWIFLLSYAQVTEYKLNKYLVNGREREREREKERDEGRKGGRKCFTGQQDQPPLRACQMQS